MVRLYDPVQLTHLRLREFAVLAAPRHSGATAADPGRASSPPRTPPTSPFRALRCEPTTRVRAIWSNRDPSIEKFLRVNKVRVDAEQGWARRWRRKGPAIRPRWRSMAVSATWFDYPPGQRICHRRIGQSFSRTYALERRHQQRFVPRQSECVRSSTVPSENGDRFLSPDRVVRGRERGSAPASPGVALQRRKRHCHSPGLPRRSLRPIRGTV
jgi:hypothetical protein